jgi:ribosomal protein S18 acetylase RimI-like enzyme
MEIRDFTIHDHDSVCRIALESWKAAYSQRYSDNKIEDIIKDWYSIQNHSGMIPLIKNGALFFKVLIIHNSIIGFVLGDINKAQLNRLYIDPTYFHNGYGKILLELFEEELERNNHNYLTVSCDKLNRIGLSFYLKEKFKIIDEDEEEYVLKKQIREKQ